jgi:hypothetical protein
MVRTVLAGRQVCAGGDEEFVVGGWSRALALGKTATDLSIPEDVDRPSGAPLLADQRGTVAPRSAATALLSRVGVVGVLW